MNSNGANDINWENILNDLNTHIKSYKEHIFVADELNPIVFVWSDSEKMPMPNPVVKDHDLEIWANAITGAEKSHDVIVKFEKALGRSLPPGKIVTASTLAKFARPGVSAEALQAALGIDEVPQIKSEDISEISPKMAQGLAALWRMDKSLPILRHFTDKKNQFGSFNGMRMRWKAAHDYMPAQTVTGHFDELSKEDQFAIKAAQAISEKAAQRDPSRRTKTDDQQLRDPRGRRKFMGGKPVWKLFLWLRPGQERFYQAQRKAFIKQHGERHAAEEVHRVEQARENIVTGKSKPLKLVERYEHETVQQRTRAANRIAETGREHDGTKMQSKNNAGIPVPGQHGLTPQQMHPGEERRTKWGRPDTNVEESGEPQSEPHSVEGLELHGLYAAAKSDTYKLGKFKDKKSVRVGAKIKEIRVGMWHQLFEDAKQGFVKLGDKEVPLTRRERINWDKAAARIAVDQGKLHDMDDFDQLPASIKDQYRKKVVQRVFQNAHPETFGTFEQRKRTEDARRGERPVPTRPESDVSGYGQAEVAGRRERRAARERAEREADRLDAADRRRELAEARRASRERRGGQEEAPPTPPPPPPAAPAPAPPAEPSRGQREPAPKRRELPDEEAIREHASRAMEAARAKEGTPEERQRKIAIAMDRERVRVINRWKTRDARNEARESGAGGSPEQINQYIQKELDNPRSPINRMAENAAKNIVYNLEQAAERRIYRAGFNAAVAFARRTSSSTDIQEKVRAILGEPKSVALPERRAPVTPPEVQEGREEITGKIETVLFQSEESRFRWINKFLKDFQSSDASNDPELSRIARSQARLLEGTRSKIAEMEGIKTQVDTLRSNRDSLVEDLEARMKKILISGKNRSSEILNNSYNEEEIGDIVRHIVETGSIQNAPHLREEHVRLVQSQLGNKRLISVRAIDDLRAKLSSLNEEIDAASSGQRGRSIRLNVGRRLSGIERALSALPGYQQFSSTKGSQLTQARIEKLRDQLRQETSVTRRRSTGERRAEARSLGPSAQQARLQGQLKALQEELDATRRSRVGRTKAAKLAKENKIRQLQSRIDAFSRSINGQEKYPMQKSSLSNPVDIVFRKVKNDYLREVEVAKRKTETARNRSLAVKERATEVADRFGVNSPEYRRASDLYTTALAKLEELQGAIPKRPTRQDVAQMMAQKSLSGAAKVTMLMFDAPQKGSSSTIEKLRNGLSKIKERRHAGHSTVFPIDPTSDEAIAGVLRSVGKIFAIKQKGKE